MVPSGIQGMASLGRQVAGVLENGVGEGGKDWKEFLPWEKSSIY